MHDMGIPANSADSVDFSTLTKPVTYQVCTPDGWVSITRQAYGNITNPNNRRILLKQEQRIINSELIKV